jgi:hypothetical protein
MAKGKNLQPGAPFIGDGERDDAEAGPHVGDDEPVEPVPLLWSVARGHDRCLNTDLGHCCTGMGPKH